MKKSTPATAPAPAQYPAVISRTFTPPAPVGAIREQIQDTLEILQLALTEASAAHAALAPLLIKEDHLETQIAPPEFLALSAAAEAARAALPPNMGSLDPLKMQALADATAEAKARGADLEKWVAVNGLDLTLERPAMQAKLLNLRGIIAPASAEAFQLSSALITATGNARHAIESAAMPAAEEQVVREFEHAVAPFFFGPQHPRILAHHSPLFHHIVMFLRGPGLSAGRPDEIIATAAQAVEYATALLAGTFTFTVTVGTPPPPANAAAVAEFVRITDEQDRAEQEERDARKQAAEQKARQRRIDNGEEKEEEEPAAVTA